LEWFEACFIPLKRISIRRRGKKYSFIYTYTMGKTIVSLVLVLFVVAMFLNGYNVEGAARGNQPKIDDIYKSQKFGKCIDCMILYKMCSDRPYLLPFYNTFCTPNDHTSNYIASSNEAPQPQSGLP
jgi:hypothetical protein